VFLPMHEYDRPFRGHGWLLRRQPEMTAQGGFRVIGTEDASFLQQRNDTVDEWLEARRTDVREHDETVGTLRLDKIDHVLGNLCRRPNEPPLAGDSHH